MLKLHSEEISGFSVTQILCEIKIGDSRNPKTAFFAFLGALNCLKFVKKTAFKKFLNS